MNFNKFYNKYLKLIDKHNRQSTEKVIPLLPEEIVHIFAAQIVVREHDNKFLSSELRRV